MTDAVTQHWMDSQAASYAAKPSSQSHLSPTYDVLGEAALEAAKLDVGIVRETSANWGPEIAQFLDHSGIDFPAAWCSAAVHAWLDQGAQITGIQPPISPTGGAKETMMRLDKIGRWINRDQISPSQISPGMILVWDRSDPARGIPQWRGHIGIVEQMGDDGETIQTIEGNIPDPQGQQPQGVHRTHRKLSDPRLLGFGVVSGPMPGDPGFVAGRRPRYSGLAFLGGAVVGLLITYYLA